VGKHPLRHAHAAATVATACTAQNLAANRVNKNISYRIVGQTNQKAFIDVARDCNVTLHEEHKGIAFAGCIRFGCEKVCMSSARPG
jgi:hypothetical protein